MTRDDIIRMAREAFGAPYSSYLEKRSWDINDKQVERFAVLVAAANKPETAIAESYRRGYEAGARAARDACIALCTQHWQCGGNAIECADAILAMAEK